MEHTVFDLALRKPLLAEAVREVMKTMSGMDFVEDRNILIPNTNYDEPYISGALLLNGEKNLLVMIGISTSHSKGIVSKMLNVDVLNIKDENLFDGIMEITNMLAGKLKSLLFAFNMPYTLSIPYVLYGDSMGIFLKKKQKVVTGIYKSDDYEVNLKILFL